MALSIRVLDSRPRRERALDSPTSETFVLERDLWDDFGIKSSFSLFSYDGVWTEIGTWKVVDLDAKGPRRTQLPTSFEKLPDHFVSLGQSVGDYERLALLGPERARFLLRGLNDLVFSPRPEVLEHGDVTGSLLRFVEARAALSLAPGVLANAGVLGQVPVVTPDRSAEFEIEVSAQLRGFSSPHRLKLNLSNAFERDGLGRLCVLVGPNGSGKTQLLGNLARAFSGLEPRDVELSNRDVFSHVIAVSYSAFDRFTHPRARGGVSYVYCGLQVSGRKAQAGVDKLAKTDREPDAETRIDLRAATKRAVREVQRLSEDRREVLLAALEQLSLERVVEAVLGSEASETTIDTLSAGEKMAFFTAVNLVSELRKGSVVLFDEPELHLHPILLSALLRTLHFLLDRFDSHAVVATHSLVPVQETPSAHVVILDLYDDGSVRTFSPPEQCFGSSLDQIARMVFRESDKDQNYARLLVDLSRRYSNEEILSFFDGELSLGARLLLASLR